MRKEVNGLCRKLHNCTPRLVRTSVESTPYKFANSQIPFEPYYCYCIYYYFISLKPMLYKFQLTINYINPPHNSSYTTIQTPNTTVLPPPSCRTHVKCTLYFGHGRTAATLGHKLCCLLYNEVSEDNAVSFLTAFHFQMHQYSRYCRQQFLAKR